MLLISTGLFALEQTPKQILFKTSYSLQIQRGRTGLTAFDSFLDEIQAISVAPVKGMPDSRWFSANLMHEPNWNSIKSNSLSFEGIDIIQPNYLNNFHIIPNDPWYSLQQMSLSELPQAWNYTTGSSTILVGVVDSGLLRDHPDLQANVYYNPNEIPDNGIDDDNNGYIDDYCGWDFADAPEMSDVALGDYIGQDNDVTDENFHGTHVAGILGAVTNNGIGIAGVCWNLKILPMRAGFRTSSGTGFLQDDDAAAAVIYAADMGVSVMNMSWGDPNYSPIIADACNYAYQKGVVLVASAGNDPGPYLSYPAKLSCVISVGAVDQYKNIAGFSSYGPELDLVAPGQMIYSTYKTEGPDTYKEMSGTSMSSPFVAGAAALIKSVQPNLSPDEVRARILNNTDDLGPSGFDEKYGHGLLNARKLMESLSSPVITVNYPADHIGIANDFDIIGTVNCPNFFRYSVMAAQDKPNQAQVWKDVATNSPSPTWYTTPVFNDVIARFQIPDLMPEGDYVIRIQYQSYDGKFYNHFRTIILDQSAPFMKPNTFSIFKRYDGQNVRYYAGALFNEPVRSELLVYASNFSQYSVFPEKLDSVQVWLLPNTIPQGSINLEVNATNSSSLTYQSPLMTNVINIDYEIITNHGYEPRQIGNAMVPLNKVYDFDMNGIPEFLAMDLPNSGYGDVKFYEPTDSVFAVNYTYENRFWPLDMGDTNGSGQEVLALNLETVSLYETPTNNTFPTTSLWAEAGISGGLLADYNGDGVKDIILVKNESNGRVIKLYKRLGNVTPYVSHKVTITNPTPTNLRNMFVPTVICTNLDNDFTPDILTADTDGDIMIYEVTSETSATMRWNHRLPVSNAYYITSGDFDGNGTTDFIVGGYNSDALDPNQTFWFFEGFTSNGNNSYVSMGSIQFNQVLSQNAIQSMDIDNDGKHEILLSLSPNFYILKYINGKFKPIFYNTSNRTYQIATWTQNGEPYFITNRTISAEEVKAFVWSKQAPFTGPSTPANLIVKPLNDRQVLLTWQANGAQSYNVYRKQADLQSQLIATVTLPTFRDTTVVANNTYHYAVSAVNNSYNPSESLLTQWFESIPMAPPLITSITMIGSNELRIVFDQPMAGTSMNPGCYKVDHNIGNPLSVNSVLNQYGVQLRFRATFPDTTDLFLLRLQNVVGLTGVAPVQTLYSFSYNPDYSSPTIENVSVLSNKKSVKITFNESISAEIANVLSNYTLLVPENDSNNTISSVSAGDDFVIVNLSGKLNYSNVPYYIIINNITDLAGNRITPNQNSCKFTLSDISNLEKVVAYPNPVKASQYANVNFLNFPTGKKGKLSIYTTAGDLVYSSNIGPFNPNNNNLTCRWDLKNQNGKKVSSGIYYYVIQMGDDLTRGKIAVIN
jgi:subtilisin family serine protease